MMVSPIRTMVPPTISGSTTVVRWTFLPVSRSRLCVKRSRLLGADRNGSRRNSVHAILGLGDQCPVFTDALVDQVLAPLADQQFDKIERRRRHPFAERIRRDHEFFRLGHKRLQAGLPAGTGPRR